MAFAFGLKSSTNWATKTHTLGADQFVEFILTRERNETYLKRIRYDLRKYKLTIYMCYFFQQFLFLSFLQYNLILNWVG